MHLKDGYIKSSSNTKHYCQFLRLNPDTLEQYKYWHDSRNIWKEIPQGIRKAGISDMEIFVRDDYAVMILEVPVSFDFEQAFGELASYDRQAEWEAFVGKFQCAENGKRSDEKWQLMERIFSLEESLKFT
ncbi:MAG: L-rhamnose mutarotase [Dysgonamonadaceae bacterium]|jgi:L-rhamnose mutarotase|nr:L-rhamnose mutarotase [Dysgonamonadaceae bacterium]